MANKYDLRIKPLTLTGGGAEELLGKVPDGKTRFVCFVKICDNGAGTKVELASDEATATIDPGSTLKDTTLLGGAAVIAFPDKIDVNNPLFSVAEKMYLNVSGTAGDELTVVYFDE